MIHENLMVDQEFIDILGISVLVWQNWGQVVFFINGIFFIERYVTFAFYY